MSDQETTPQIEIPAEAVVEAAAPVAKDEPVRKPKARKPAKAAPAPKVEPVVEAPRLVAKPARKPVRAKRVPAPIRFVKKPVVAPAPKPATPRSETFAMTTDFTEAFKTVFADAQGKAKAAYEKGTASLAEAGEFAKGNAEAVVESGKILAEGLQTLSTGLVADSKAAFEGLTAEVKELTAAKSPADFFKLQSELIKKYFDSSIAYSSKHGEAMLKLTSDAVAPLSRRASLAIEKIKAA
ncbi:MAG: phasin family protein [Sphingomonadales bacterium]|nr:phasin family protein [Sphingomonadales bacterium]